MKDFIIKVARQHNPEKYQRHDPFGTNL